MDDAGAPAYLGGTHIQLGFYWHSIPETDAYRNVLKHLLGCDYKAHPVLTMMRTRNGALPRFDQLATHGLPAGDVVLSRHWTPERSAADHDWFPVSIRLIPTTEENVEIDLGFAFMHEESLRGGDPHVIEITASGADLSVCMNTNPDELEPEIAESARRTDRWSRVMFQRICDELKPDYAMNGGEDDLQPPTSLLAESSDRSLSVLYVSDRLLGSAVAEAAKTTPDVAEWAAKRLRHGVFSGWRVGADPESNEAVGAFVRKLLLERFAL